MQHSGLFPYLQFKHYMNKKRDTCKLFFSSLLEFEAQSMFI